MKERIDKEETLENEIAELSIMSHITIGIERSSTTVARQEQLASVAAFLLHSV